MERRTCWSMCAVNTSNKLDVVAPKISERHAQRIVEEACDRAYARFRGIDKQTQQRLQRVLHAMQKHGLSQTHFTNADGYGHADYGVQVMDDIYASVFGAESGLVRIQLVSGTHAIAAALFGVLRPGDEMLSVTGRVYDTLEEVIGLRGHGQGSLMDFGITYRQVDLKDGSVDLDAVARNVNERTKVVFIQKSFGYSWRPPVHNDDVARIVQVVRGVKRDVTVVVDNCFSELCEDREVTHESIGADVAAGSLIKGIGGGIAPSGGYIVGRRQVVQKAASRLYAPGIEGAASLGLTKTIAQGLFMAPCTIAQSLKASALIAETMWQLGYETQPAVRCNSYVRAVKLGSAARVQAFCQAVQRSGAVGSGALAVAGASPGYGDAVTFAQSSFVDGATAELSADGPMRAPWAVFAQGALCWQHWALALVHVVRAVGYAQR